MNIGIDASRAFLRDRTGTEEYSHEIIRHLAKISSQKHHFLLYVRRGAKADFELPSNFFMREIGHGFFWTQLSLSREMLKGEADVLFVPSHSVPFVHPCQTVATVHGLEFEMCPQCYSLRERTILKINTLLSIKFAAKIITPSQNTKNDLVGLYKINPGKIRMIYHGIAKPENIRKTKSSGKFNVLFIGRLEKRKNIIGIIRAFEELMKRVKNYEKPEINLVLAGKEGLGFKEIKEKIDHSLYKDKIILSGYVTEEEKHELYQQANLFIFPSFYEGFGIPVLEAMSHGVPVVCSNSSSLQEIADGAALLVDPKNIHEISSAILSIFNDSEAGEDLASKGIERAEKFNWERCAKETLDALVDWK